MKRSQQRDSKLRGLWLEGANYQETNFNHDILNELPGYLYEQQGSKTILVLLLEVEMLMKTFQSSLSP